MKYFFSFFLFAILTLACDIGAQEKSSQEPSEQVKEKDPILDPLFQDVTTKPEKETETFEAKFMNMLFILGLLIGFMILASWALKRLMKTKMTQINTSSNIKVLETRYLSPRASLYLIEVENQKILISESPTTVTYLTAISSGNETHLK